MLGLAMFYIDVLVQFQLEHGTHINFECFVCVSIDEFVEVEKVCDTI